MLFNSQLSLCNKVIKSREHITICYLFLARVSVGHLETLLLAGAKFRSVVTVPFWDQVGKVVGTWGMYSQWVTEALTTQTYFKFPGVISITLLLAKVIDVANP